MTEDLRAKTCCFTGHRRIPEEALPRLERRLNEELEALAARGVIYFGAGGALGFDTLAAEAVIRLQRTRPQVKLILVLPSPDQTRGWSSGNVRRYEAIRARANKMMYVASTYGWWTAAGSACVISPPKRAAPPTPSVMPENRDCR